MNKQTLDVVVLRMGLLVVSLVELGTRVQNSPEIE